MLNAQLIYDATGLKSPDARTQANVESVLQGIDARGEAAGLNKPHRLAHYLAQLGHESGRFRYDRELWGPTATQRGYEGRRDLGNTEPGDGYRYRGRTGGQITGRYNYRKFTQWVRTFYPEAPDFEANPDLLNTDPWEGLGPMWYWEAHGLNVYADRNDPENLTKRWNGGLNGYADRLALYAAFACVFLGYGVGADEVRRLQRDLGLRLVDGDAGPMTRQAMHNALVAAGNGATQEPAPPPPVTVDLAARLSRMRALAAQIALASAELDVLAQMEDPV